MSISMYQASVPVFIHALKALSGVLEKGAKHAEARGIDPAVLLGSRLYPDMFPLARQVQIASDNAKGPSARLAGLEPPKYEDNEVTFADLQARIAKTIAYLQGLKAEQIDGSEERRSAGVQGPGLSVALRAAELLFPLRHRLCHPAPQRRRDRQEGFPGRLIRIAGLRLRLVNERSRSTGRLPDCCQIRQLNWL
jgi:hypothetical protein